MSDDAATAEPPTQRGILCKVLVAASGNFLEWYDFAIFGIFAAEIGGAFFPIDESVSERQQQQQALISSFTVYAGAFIVRPLGGVLFGAIGDRYGREKALLATILLMALPTLTISVLPTYEQWGVAAAVLLSLLRMLQGVAAGGELPGALVYAVESAAPGRKGFFGAMVQASGVGSLLASAVAGVLHATLGSDAVARWGWRIPFALGGLIAFLSCCARRNFGATPEFTQAKRDGALETGHPLRWLVSRRGAKTRRVVAKLACVEACGMVGFYSLFIWAPSHLRLRRHVEWSLGLNTALLMLWMVALLVAGALSDRMQSAQAGGGATGRGGFLRVALGGACGVALVAPLTFYAVGFLPMCVAAPALALLVACHAFHVGPLQAWLVLSLTDVSTRYSALGLGYNLSAALLAGTTPLVATYLAATAADAVGAGGYLSLAAAVSALALHLDDAGCAPCCPSGGASVGGGSHRRARTGGVSASGAGGGGSGEARTSGTHEDGVTLEESRGGGGGGGTRGLASMDAARVL